MRITNPDARLYFNDNDNNRLFYNAGVEGPELRGDKKIKLTAPDGVLTNKKLCIGSTCFHETDLKKMKSLRMMGGFAIDGGGSTMMLEEGGWHNLYSNAKYDSWTNDRWDRIFIYRGWKVEVAKNGNGEGNYKVFTNTNENVKKCIIDGNQVSSYKLTWVGYG